MAGLLSDVLPFIYSRSNSLKRNVNSLLSDPVDYLKQAVGQGNDDARVQNGLLADAVKEKGYGPANQALQDSANSVASTNIGPLSVKGKPFVYPQDAALATAQRNAALPYSEGGLNLPADNTAMQRARALGYETGDKKALFHATRDDVAGEIDPSKSDFGFHMGTLQQADARVKSRAPTGFTYPEGANIMPLVMDKYANMLKVADEGSFHADSLAPQLAKKGLMDKRKAQELVSKLEGNWMEKMEPQYDQQMRDIVAQNDYDGLKYSNAQEGPGISYAVSNPSVIRSRFAAFDPMRRDSPDILAGLLPLSMADEDNRNQLRGLLNP